MNLVGKNFRFLFLSLTFSAGLCFAADREVKDIEVVPSSESSTVLSIVPFKKGEAFDPQLMEISKRLILATDKFEKADLEWNEASGKMQISVSPKLFFESIVWTGEEVPDRSSIQRACLQPYEVRDISQERISQISRCLLQELQSRGHLDATISLEPENAILYIRATVGASYSIKSLSFEGAKRLRKDEFVSNISNQEGKVFQPLKLDADTKEILKIYLDQGFYFTQVFKPSTDIDTNAKTVSLTWRIKESEKFDIEFIGSTTRSDSLQRFIDREETFPSWFVEEMTDEIENDFRSRGYLNAKVEVHRETIEPGSVNIKIQTTAGSLYRLVDPEWIGIGDRVGIEKIYSSFDELRVGSAFREKDFRSVMSEDFSNLMISKGYIDLQIRGIDFIIDHERKKVRPIITMSEGDIYLIQESSIEGVPDQYKDTQEFKDLRKNLKIGMPFDRIKIDQLQTLAVRALVNEGFLDAVVGRESTRTQTGLIIREKVLAGPQYRVAKVLIRGAIKTNYEVLRREVLLKPGDIYNEDRIQDSIAQILRLGIARSIDIQALEKNPEKSEVYVLIDIQEAARFQFELGPGYGTLDGLRATFRGTYANIGGRARRLSLYARGNRQLESSYVPSETEFLNPQAVPFVERRLTLEYFEPSLLRLPVDGRLVFSHSKTNEKRLSLGLLRNAFTAAVDYRLNRKWMFSTHYDIEFSDPFNVVRAQNTAEEDAKSKRLTSLGEVVSIDYVDDTFNPTKGSRSRLTGDLYDKRFGGDQNFWQSTVKESVFLPLWTFSRGKAIGFSVSSQFGFSNAYHGTPEVPVEKRFRTGGENSVRGYGEKSINPQSEGTRQFDGGASFFSFMTEVNLPLFYGMDLLGFFDGGNTYRSNKQFHPWDLRYGAGPGIRWNTPVGPLKFGYGFIVGRKDGEPLGHFYFGVGPI
jgi:outer membrane protein insertion porin family